MQADWTTIGENVETNDLFNVNLFKLIPKEPNYYKFNKCITTSAGMTDVTTKRKKEGWFHHIQDILLPLNETRDRILTKYCTLGIRKGDTSFTKKQLHNQQQDVNDAISLAKANW